MSLVSSLSILTCHVILLSCILCLPFFLFLLHLFFYVVFLTLAFLVFPVASSLSRFCLSYLLIHCSFPFNLYRSPPCLAHSLALFFLFYFPFLYFFVTLRFHLLSFLSPLACTIFCYLSLPLCPFLLFSLFLSPLYTFCFFTFLFLLSASSVFLSPLPSTLHPLTSLLFPSCPFPPLHSFPLVLSPSHSLSFD